MLIQRKGFEDYKPFGGSKVDKFIIIEEYLDENMKKESWKKLSNILKADQKDYFFNSKTQQEQY